MTTSIKTRLAQQVESTTTPTAVIKDLSSAHYCATYRITHDDGDYIIKQLRETASADERNRFHHSVRMQQALADCPVSTPKIIHYDAQRALFVSNFHTHTPFAYDTQARHACVQAVAKQLSSLHTTQVNIGIRYTPAQTYVSQYIDTIARRLLDAHHPENTQSVSDELRTFARTIRHAIERFDAQTDRVVLCHNDLNANNVLFNFNSGTPTTASVTLIDWEFAALNNPLFDLASLMFYLNLSPNESEQLCKTYSEALSYPPERQHMSSTAINNETLHLAQIVVRVLDSLWSTYATNATRKAWDEQATARQKIITLCEQLSSR